VVGGPAHGPRVDVVQFMPSLAFVCIKNGKFIHCSCAVCTLFALGGACNAFSPAARRIVVEAINYGTVAVLQNGHAVSVLLVRLHPDTEQKQHAQSASTVKISATQTLCSMVYSGPEKVY
jgi:hypothetical protein